MGAISPEVDFSTVTEVAGHKTSIAQLDRMFGRYYFAAEFCAGKDVLEIGCGTGHGVGLLARRAKRVTGLDIDPELVTRARLSSASGCSPVARPAADDTAPSRRGFQQ